MSCVRNFEVDLRADLAAATCGASVATPATGRRGDEFHRSHRSAGSSATPSTAAAGGRSRRPAAPITAPSSGATNSICGQSSRPVASASRGRARLRRRRHEAAPRRLPPAVYQRSMTTAALPNQWSPRRLLRYPPSSFVATAITRSSPPPPRSSPPPPRSASPPPPRFSPPPPRLTPPSRNRSPSPPPPDFSRPVEEYTLKSKWSYDPLLRLHDRLIDAANGSPPMGGGDDDPHEWNPRHAGSVERAGRSRKVLGRPRALPQLNIGVRKSSALTVATRQQPTPTQ